MLTEEQMDLLVSTLIRKVEQYVERHSEEMKAEVLDEEFLEIVDSITAETEGEIDSEALKEGFIQHVEQKLGAMLHGEAEL